MVSGLTLRRRRSRVDSDLRGTAHCMGQHAPLDASSATLLKPLRIGHGRSRPFFLFSRPNARTKHAEDKALTPATEVGHPATALARHRLPRL